MPVYNRRSIVREAIDSILAQSFRDFEFIIIDDGSTDGTDAAVNSVRDPRIRFLRNESNLGNIKSRNRGMALATGEYIAPQDSDDISLPSRLALQTGFLDAHPEVAMLGGQSSSWDVNGHYYHFDLPCDAASIRWHMMIASCWHHSAIMIRSGVMREMGGYQELPDYSGYQTSRDYDLFCRIARKHETAQLPQVLVHCRKQRDSITNLWNSSPMTIEISRENMELTLGHPVPVQVATALCKLDGDNGYMPQAQQLLRELLEAFKKRGNPVTPWIIRHYSELVAQTSYLLHTSCSLRRKAPAGA